MLLLLFVSALIAGYIDALVGGGGLITIPALLMAGVPPLMALGTNKLQAVFGSATASFILLQSGIVSFSKVRSLMLMAFFGSFVGAVAVQFFDASILDLLIPIIIFAIAVYFVFAASHVAETRAAKLDDVRYGRTVVPAIGLYDGMFGPGTGSFFVAAGVSLRGQTIVEATATAKTLNFATNLASLLVFFVFGQLMWLVGLCMMLGQIAGAHLGARHLVEINPGKLRALLIGMCLVMLASILYNRYIFL